MRLAKRTAAKLLNGDEARRIVAKRRSCRSCCACGSGRRWKLCPAVQSALSQRAAASALSSGRVLNAIAAFGAALCTALNHHTVVSLGLESPLHVGSGCFIGLKQAQVCVPAIR
jgi:hypothetical protein